MKTFALATAALLASAAVPAFAQDMTPPPPPADPAATAPMDPAAAPATDPAFAGPADPAAATSSTGSASGYGAAPSETMTGIGGQAFTGARAEFFGGWARTRTRANPRTPGAFGRKRNQDSFIAGALGGYDIPIGDKLIVGAFGSYAFNTERTCRYDNAGPIVRGCLKAGREIEGGGRVGIKGMQDKALLYVKGAYVNGKVRGRFSDGTAGSVARAQYLDGWRAGAGIEYNLTSNFYTKVEYDYTRFERYDAGDVALNNASSYRRDRNQVLGGFGIRF